MFKFLRSLFNGTAPFIQRNRRLELANHLAMNVSDEQYDHSYLQSSPGGPVCALGHAGVGGLHGFYVDYRGSIEHHKKPFHVAVTDTYGNDFVGKISMAHHKFTRAQAIEALRNY